MRNVKNKKFPKSAIFILLLATSISSCKLIGELSYQVTPSPLEMHGDSIKISVTIKFPEKGLNKKISN